VAPQAWFGSVTLASFLLPVLHHREDRQVLFRRTPRGSATTEIGRERLPKRTVLAVRVGHVVAHAHNITLSKSAVGPKEARTGCACFLRYMLAVKLI
jgi:hypothetical protein